MFITKVINTLYKNAYVKPTQRRALVEKMAQDVAECYPGYGSLGRGPIATRAKQILKKQEHVLVKLSNAKERQEYLNVESHIGCNFQG